MQNQKTDFSLPALRQLIAVTLLFMMTGTVMELYLLDHYEDVQQLIPILCIGAALLLLLILHFRRTLMLRKLFKWILAITAVSGVYGIYLHLNANFEFEQEMKPTAASWDLFLESFSGALPALAPGSMIVLALIGYSYLKILKHQ